MNIKDLENLEEAVKGGVWLKVSIPTNYVRKVDFYTHDGKSLKRTAEVKAETLNFALTKASRYAGDETSLSEDAPCVGHGHANSYIDYLLINGYYMSIGADEENYILKFWHKDQDAHKCKEIYSTTAPNTTNLLTLLRYVELSWARYLVEPLSKWQDIIDIKDKNEFLNH